MKNTLSEQYLKLYRLNTSKLEHKERANQYKFVNFINKKYLQNKAQSLLDVACGEGKAEGLLKKDYIITGIDKDKDSITIAKKNMKGVKFFIGNIQDFRLNKLFDIVMSVHGIDHGHETRKNLGTTLKNLSKHLNKGGAIIFDINFLKELWSKNDTTIHTLQNGSERWIRIFHQETDKDIGTSYFTTLLLKGNKVYGETSKPHKSMDLLDFKKINKSIADTGLSVTIYDGWSNKKFKKLGKVAPVFVLIKR